MDAALRTSRSPSVTVRLRQGSEGHSNDPSPGEGPVAAWNLCWTPGGLKVERGGDMDRDADFAAFANAEALRLARSALLLGASHHEAEDLTQTTLVRCYVYWSKVVGAADRDAYVMRVLLNEFARSRRRRWWNERPTAQLPDTSLADVTGEVDAADAVARALGRLGPGQREAIVLRYYAHMSEAQIAETLGIPVGTVKSRLSRAHRQLAEDVDIETLRNGQVT